jgi:hypothetical protein
MLAKRDSIQASEFRKHLHQKHLEAIRAEVLAEKKKPPASEKGTKVREKSKKA